MSFTMGLTGLCCGLQYFSAKIQEKDKKIKPSKFIVWALFAFCGLKERISPILFLGLQRVNTKITGKMGHFLWPNRRNKLENCWNGYNSLGR